MTDESRQLPELRASDADRERVLEVVRQAHAEGRLTLNEMYERLEAVYQAKTYTDLDRVTDDLPVDEIGRAQPPAPRAAAALPAAPRRTGLPPEIVGTWATWATAVSITTLIWVIGALPFDDIPYFWPIWVAGPWGLINLISTIGWWLGNRGGGGEGSSPAGG